MQRMKAPPPAQLLCGEVERALLEGAVVQFAVVGPPDRVDLEDDLWGLVGSKVGLDVIAKLLRFDGGAGVSLDQRSDRLAPLLVRQADYCGIGDGGMPLQALFDFFGVDLLATGVDALAAASEEGDGAVDLDRGVVAGD